jgi:hypothetical protein
MKKIIRRFFSRLSYNGRQRYVKLSSENKNKKEKMSVGDGAKAKNPFTYDERGLIKTIDMEMVSKNIFGGKRIYLFGIKLPRWVASA